MEYRDGLDIASDPDVYPPSEDSIFLAETLDIRPGEKVLEVGCGSGIVSIQCALSGAIVTSCDINPKAVALTRRNAEANGVNIDVVESDVYSNIDGRFDTIVFNLPYLPVSDEGELARAWSGGPDGLGPLPRLLQGAPEHLLPGGRVVIVVSSLMDQDALNGLLAHYSVRVLGELPLFFEKLRVLEVRRVGDVRRHPPRELPGQALLELEHQVDVQLRVRGSAHLLDAVQRRPEVPFADALQRFVHIGLAVGCSRLYGLIDVRV
jgi:release factor glutamine methyltransferase